LTELSGETGDITTGKRIDLLPNSSNYVYLRAHTTVPHKGQVRLFFVPSSVLLHPIDYNNQDSTAWDVDPNDQTQYVTALRSYDTTSLPSGRQQVIFEEPFLLTNLKPPGHGSDHYCFVAECKPHRTKQELDEGVPPYTWPHDDVNDFQSNSEFAAWIAHRRVVMRNVGYSCDNDGDSFNKRQAFKLPSELLFEFPSGDTYQ
jgi:hypothetical protein